jgi:hypothetical protein
VTGQQEVGDALLDSVLMPAVATNELSLRHLSLKKKVVEILECLLVRLELKRCRSLLRELRETQL